MKKIGQYLFTFLPFGFYLAAVEIIGEAHPFSKFSMYSSFPSEADYFYVADEENHSVSTSKLAGISIDELKDMIEVRAKEQGIHRHDSLGMHKIAQECLSSIKQQIHSPVKIKRIKWVRHEMYILRGEVAEQKTVLAECDLN